MARPSGDCRCTRTSWFSGDRDAAWLIDGTSLRYVGPGLGTLAVGLGLVLGDDVFGLQGSTGDHSIVYPLLGVALIAISRISPREAQGIGGFLFIVGTVVWAFLAGASYNGGWTSAAILAAWGIWRIIQTNRHPTPDPRQEQPQEEAGSRPAMAR